jgi:hypothetical protein
MRTSIGHLTLLGVLTPSSNTEPTMTQRANCWSTVCLLDHVQKPLAAPELAARAWAAARREDDATSEREVSGRASSE